MLLTTMNEVLCGLARNLPTHTAFSLWLSILLVKICTLRYVSVQGSAVSGLQERNRTYQHKICRANVIRYQVLLAEYYQADTKYCCCRAKRRQFPIRLAFSMTIDKSQGRTFDKICLFFETCIQSRATVCCCLKSSVTGLTKCCIWDERDC
jgi:hypothetical protein